MSDRRIKRQRINSNVLDIYFDAAKEPDLRLLYLPNEVIIKIFEYLNIIDLLSITKLNNDRLTKLTFFFKNLNFCHESTIGKEDFCSIFTSERLQYVQELTLDCLVWVPVSTIVSCIAKCQHLKFLSVLFCGINCKDILRIFKSCQEIEELAWNVICNCTTKSSSQEHKYPLLTSLKHFHYVGVFRSCDTIRHLLRLSPVMDEVCPLYGKNVLGIDLNYSDIDVIKIDVETYLKTLAAKPNVQLTGKFQTPAKICDIIQCLRPCTNLTHLNLDFCSADGGLFYALTNSCLKKLRTLRLNSCAFVSSDSIKDSEKYSLEAFTHICENLECFCLSGCSICNKGPNEDAMKQLGNWKKLMYLSLKCISTLRTCQFLKHVSNNCLDLEVLSIWKIGDPRVCHFIPFLCYLLRNSKRLTFLRINHSSFYPLFEGFWKSISHAKNLQCLSLNLKLLSWNFRSPVLTEIAKLSNLHLFYMNGNPEESQNFVKLIKKQMIRHGHKDHIDIAIERNEPASISEIFDYITFKLN